MPSGRTHDRLTLWSLPWIAGVSFIVTRSGELTLILATTFLFSGLMFGPDLDIYSIQFKRWGKLCWLWLPYQKILRHRSILSHGFIIGTTLRVLYFVSFLAFIAIFAVAIAQLVWGFSWNWQHFARNTYYSIMGDYTEEAIAAFLGLELGAMTHFLADWIVSAFKRYPQNNQKKLKSKRPKKKIHRR